VSRDRRAHRLACFPSTGTILDAATHRSRDPHQLAIAFTIEASQRLRVLWRRRAAVEIRSERKAGASWARLPVLWPKQQSVPTRGCTPEALVLLRHVAIGGVMRGNRSLAVGVGLVAVAVAALVIAIGGGGSYTTTLISKIGAGSDAVGQIVPVWENEQTIQGISHAPLYYPDYRWVSYLEQGDLAPLTDRKLTHLIRDANGDLVLARRVEGQLKVLSGQVAAETVPAGLTLGLSDGSQLFVGDWNGYLSDAAKTVTDFGEVTDSDLVFIVDFETLANQARIVKAGGSRALYKTALRRVQRDLQRISKLQLLASKPLVDSKGWTAIMKLTKSDQDASAIFQKVAAQYPSGVIPGPGRGYPFQVAHPL
jgi:hypothetical protein